MTWVIVFLVAAVVAGFLAWASVRQRRHSGGRTMDQARTDTHRLPGAGGVYRDGIE